MNREFLNKTTVIVVCVVVIVSLLLLRHTSTQDDREAFNVGDWLKQQMKGIPLIPQKFQGNKWNQPVVMNSGTGWSQTATAPRPPVAPPNAPVVPVPPKAPAPVPPKAPADLASAPAPGVVPIQPIVTARIAPAVVTREPVYQDPGMSEWYVMKPGPLRIGTRKERVHVDYEISADRMWDKRYPNWNANPANPGWGPKKTLYRSDTDRLYFEPTKDEDMPSINAALAAEAEQRAALARQAAEAQRAARQAAEAQRAAQKAAEAQRAARQAAEAQKTLRLPGAWPGESFIRGY